MKKVEKTQVILAELFTSREYLSLVVKDGDSFYNEDTCRKGEIIHGESI